MSITSCFLLFLLCLSLHACRARRLGAFESKNKLEKKLHFSIKNDMNGGFKKSTSAVVVEVKSSSSKEELGSIKEESIEGSHVDDHSQKLEDADETVENEKENSSGAVQTNKKSAVSVSWRVPHRKRGEKNPGFNLDYSPPKTHPPSHN